MWLHAHAYTVFTWHLQLVDCWSASQRPSISAINEISANQLQVEDIYNISHCVFRWLAAFKSPLSVKNCELKLFKLKIIIHFFIELLMSYLQIDIGQAKAAFHLNMTCFPEVNTSLWQECDREEWEAPVYNKRNPKAIYHE